MLVREDENLYSRNDRYQDTINFLGGYREEEHYDPWPKPIVTYHPVPVDDITANKIADMYSTIIAIETAEELDRKFLEHENAALAWGKYRNKVPSEILTEPEVSYHGPAVTQVTYSSSRSEYIHALTHYDSLIAKDKMLNLVTEQMRPLESGTWDNDGENTIVVQESTRTDVSSQITRSITLIVVILQALFIVLGIIGLL